MSKKRKKRPNRAGKRGSIDQKQLRDSVRHMFGANPGMSFSIRQIIKKTGVRDKKSKESIKAIVFDMERAQKIKKARNGNYTSTKEAEFLVGKVDHVNPKFAYIVIPEREDDIWVKTEDLKTAVDGDTVRVMETAMATSSKRAEGRVEEIISRAREEFVGRIEISENFAFVIPDNKKYHFDVFVYPEKIGGAIQNDKVLCRIKKWQDKGRKNPVGEVVQVLGPAGENEAEIHSIMAEFGLPFQFPEDVEKAAEKINEEIPEKEIKQRRDLRDVTTFTIDPVDAKDFDDALSLKKLSNGNWQVGVHIADVSHYVKPDTILDKEAIDRATSVYLVDRTIPMLPEKLSNKLCSLRPNEDKLTFSAMFELDENVEIQKEWFGRTVIHSDRRFTYEEAQERIESKEGDFQEEINILNGMAHKLKDQRFKKGAINFETVEVKFKLDEDGKPLGVFPKERKDAHKMIEEFMLLANKRVAEYVFGLQKRTTTDANTFVYRIHDNPDPEKLDNFGQFAVKFGHQVNFLNGNISSNLNQLMEDIEGRPEQNVLESLAIRAMAKAKYTTETKGHFGLAFDHYSHFTSPIRRYPDVMVHRLLQHYLDGGKSPERDEYEELCLHSSDREKRAADAERASIKYKQVEFMSMVEDKAFEGIVSGVTEWGVYVEIIETKCEGMVRMVDMDDDYYEFDEKNYRIVGRSNKRIITLGDKVTVTVQNTDIDRRIIDLDFVWG